MSTGPHRRRTLASGRVHVRKGAGARPDRDRRWGFLLVVEVHGIALGLGHLDDVTDRLVAGGRRCIRRRFTCAITSSTHSTVSGGGPSAPNFSPQDFSDPLVVENLNHAGDPWTDPRPDLRSRWTAHRPWWPLHLTVAPALPSIRNRRTPSSVEVSPDTAFCNCSLVSSGAISS